PGRPAGAGSRTGTTCPSGRGRRRRATGRRRSRSSPAAARRTPAAARGRRAPTSESSTRRLPAPANGRPVRSSVRRANEPKYEEVSTVAEPISHRTPDPMPDPSPATSDPTDPAARARTLPDGAVVLDGGDARLVGLED